MTKRVKFISMMLVICMMLTYSLTTAVYAEPGVVGSQQTINFSGSGYSGYSQSWEWKYLNTWVGEVGYYTCINFGTGDAAWAAGIAARDAINSGFNMEGVFAGAVIGTLSIITGGTAGVALGVGGTIFGVATLANYSLPPIQPGYHLVITSNCTQQYDSSWRPVGSPTTKQTITLYNANWGVVSTMSRTM